MLCITLCCADDSQVSTNLGLGCALQSDQPKLLDACSMAESKLWDRCAGGGGRGMVGNSTGETAWQLHLSWKAKADKDIAMSSTAGKRPTNFFAGGGEVRS